MRELNKRKDMLDKRNKKHDLMENKPEMKRKEIPACYVTHLQYIY